MSLQDEIDRKEKQIRTDSYTMSIGEIISLYNEDELNLHPEFQRYFRWKERQKSTFIESILLGIPIPSIFVYQRKDGVWDVIDGIQRLSTIFEFVGILTDQDGNKMPSLSLHKTEYLPSLEGMVWEDKENDDSSKCFNRFQRISFKRKSIDIKIIMEESGDDTHIELFKRINMGGSIMSAHEYNRFLVLLVNRDFLSFLEELSADENFNLLCSSKIDKDLFATSYDFALVSRFLVLKNSSFSELEKASDISSFISDQLLALAKDDQFDFDEEKRIFKRTFQKLRNINIDHFSVWFSIAAFDVVSIGLSPNIDSFKDNDNELIQANFQKIFDDLSLQERTNDIDQKNHLLDIYPIIKEIFKHEN